MPDRKAVNKRYDDKRRAKPMINAIRDVPEVVIEKLEYLAEVQGSKKLAIIDAINERYKALKNNK